MWFLLNGSVHVEVGKNVDFEKLLRSFMSLFTIFKFVDLYEVLFWVSESIILLIYIIAGADFSIPGDAACCYVLLPVTLEWFVQMHVKFAE